MSTWPASLPQYILQDGFSESFAKNTVRTAMDVGPPKMRKRSTNAPRPVSVQQYMTDTQLNVFDTFYASTLGWGAERFDWVHPRTQAVKEFRFTIEPVYTPEGAGYMVQMKLEIMD